MPENNRGGGVVLLAALLVTVAGVDAFNDISRYTAITQVNNFLNQNDSITSLCDEGDQNKNFTSISQNTDGTTSTVKVNCQFAQHIYSTNIVGWVPKAARLGRVRSCLSNNLAQYNSTGETPTPGPPPELTGVRFYNRTNGTQPLTFMGRSAGKIWHEISCNAPIIGAAIGGFFSQCDRVTYEELENFQNDIYETLQEYNKTIGLLAQQTELMKDQFALIQASFEDVKEWQIDTQYSVGNLTNSTRYTQQQIDVLAASVGADNAVINGRIDTTQQQLLALTATFQQYALQGGSEFNQTMALFASTIDDVNELVGNLSLTVYANQQDVVQKMLVISQSLTGLSQSISLLQTRVPTRVPLQTLAHQQIKAFLDSSPPYKVFITDIGTPPPADPYNLPPELAAFPIESAVSSYVYNTSGFPSAAISTLTFTCSGLYLAYNSPIVTSETTLKNTFGPPGCNSTHQGPAFCNCWVQIQEQGCFMPTISTPTIDIDPTSKAAWDSRFYPVLSQPTICATSPAPLAEAIPGNVIRGPDDFLAYQRVLCKRGLWFSEPTYQIISGFFAANGIPVPFNAYACTADVNKLMNPPPGSLNLYYLTVNMFILAYGYASTGYLGKYDQITGQIPNNMTIVEEPFARQAYGPVASCTQAIMAAYDTSSFVPVYRIDPTETIVPFAVYIDESPYTAASAVLTNENSFLLPGAATYLVGFPNDWSTIWNIPPEQVVVSQDPEQRAGAVTYPIFGTPNPPTPEEFTIEAWVAANGADFNHADAGNSASVWEQPVQCTTVDGNRQCRCVGSSPVVNAGPWCVFLETYTPNFGSTNAIVFTSLKDKVQITYAVPQGQLIATMGSACPIVTSDKPSLREVTLYLYNDLPQSNRIKVIQHGACAQEHFVTINPKSTELFFVAYCPLTPPGEKETITFEYTPGTGVYLPCNTTLDATIVPSNPTLFQGAGNLNLTEQLRYMTTSNVALAMQGITAAMTQIGNSLLNTMLLTFAYNGVNISTTTTAQMYSDFYDQLRNITATITGDLLDNANRQFNYTDLISDLRAKSESALAASVYAQELAQNKTRDLIDKLAASAVNLEAITAKQAEIEAAFAAASATLAAFAQIQYRTEGGSGLDGIVDFLSSIGGVPIDWARKAGEAVIGLAGDARDFVTDTFGSTLGNLFLPVLIALGAAAVLAGIIYVIYYCAKQKPDADKFMADFKQLQAEVAALKAQLGVATGSIAALPATAGKRRDSQSDAACCSGCCATRPQAPKYQAAAVDDYGVDLKTTDDEE
jgi:hypothetical protein